MAVRPSEIGKPSVLAYLVRHSLPSLLPLNRFTMSNGKRNLRHQFTWPFKPSWVPLWKLTVRLEDPVYLNKIVQRDNKKRREPPEIRKTGNGIEKRIWTRVVTSTRMHYIWCWVVRSTISRQNSKEALVDKKELVYILLPYLFDSVELPSGPTKLAVPIFLGVITEKTRKKC
jgi:hypothetical protein